MSISQLQSGLPSSLLYISFLRHLGIRSIPFPEVMRSANRFIAESPNASIGVLEGRGGDGVIVEGSSAFYICQYDWQGGMGYSPL